MIGGGGFLSGMEEIQCGSLLFAYGFSRTLQGNGKIPEGNFADPGRDPAISKGTS